MFPNADNTPSEFPKFAVHAAVTGAVASELRVPEFPVLLGPRAVLRAAVPKAAIDKYTKPRCSKNEIRTPDYLLPPPPSGYSVLSENLNQPQLCCFVAMGADKAHHL